jgi:1-acyl-sn-glycerol-3-phosphate acyltransferase
LFGVTNEQAHLLAREKGVSKPLYALVRALLVPLLRLWFRMHVSGAEHIPRTGAAIVAPNHKSFLDSFFVAVCTPRHLLFMAKTELIELLYGRLLVRLGAFPVMRGQSDADAIETARTILAQGGLLALFPEGTRIRDPDELGHPRRGAGRLALETGSPLVPAAITGTDNLFWGRSPSPAGCRWRFRSPSMCRRSRPPRRGRPNWPTRCCGPRWRASTAACVRGRRWSRPGWRLWASADF